MSGRLGFRKKKKGRGKTGENHDMRLYPSSPIRVCIQTTWQLQSESAMYSASVEDKAMVFCAFVVHDMRPPANLTKKPEVDRRVFTSEAQSESVHALSP